MRRVHEVSGFDSVERLLSQPFLGRNPDGTFAVSQFQRYFHADGARVAPLGGQVSLDGAISGVSQRQALTFDGVGPAHCTGSFRMTNVPGTLTPAVQVAFQNL